MSKKYTAEQIAMGERMIKRWIENPEILDETINRILSMVPSLQQFYGV